MKPNRVVGSRRHHRAAAQADASPRTSSLPSPVADDDEGDQAGTRENVLQSADASVLTSVRGVARLLQSTLDVWLSTPGCTLGEELNDALKPAIDALWRIR